MAFKNYHSYEKYYGVEFISKFTDKKYKIYIFFIG